jgi:hypothetical protein
VKSKINSENWAGKSTREIAEKRRQLRKKLGLSAAVLVILVSCAFLYYLQSGHPALIVTACGFGLFLLFVRNIDRTVIPVMDELHSWEKLAVNGAKAEEKLGTLLDQFSSDYIVLHDVKTDCGNIDHLAFRIENFKIELLSFVPNHLAPSPALR